LSKARAPAASAAGLKQTTVVYFERVGIFTSVLEMSPQVRTIAKEHVSGQLIEEVLHSVVKRIIPN
jgi:hypothetical protein